MKIVLFLIAFFAFAGPNTTTSNETADPTPPVTKKIPKIFTEHGNTRTDDYFWLSDPKDSAVIDHLKEENAYTVAYMKHTEDLQKKIYDELIARIDQKASSLPTKRNEYWYYTRYEEGRQYPFYCRKKKDIASPEEVFMDVPAMAEGHQIYMVRGWTVARNNNLLAAGIDTTGGRRSTLYIKDLNSGKMLPETVSNTSGNFAWSSDSKTLYYVLNDHTVRPYKLMKHEMGTDPNTDKTIYTENDSTYEVYLSVSNDNHYIFINCGSTNTSEVRYIDATKTDATPVMIQPRTNNLEYSVDYYEGNVFHIRTNNKAENFKFVETPVASPGVNNWKDVIPHSKTAYLQDAVILKDFYVVQSKVNGLTEIKVINRKDNSSYNVDFGEEAFVANMYMATDDYASDSIRYSYSSLTTPSSDFMYNLSSKQKQLLKQQKVGVNEKYTSKEKLFANGGSAGGMLMGAVINLRPNLFRGVLAEVPWMDVVTDMFNADLPLTTLEYDQWGDPNKKEYYDYMLSWSPYDNVKKANYPAIFSTGGLNDTQVPYYSPAKWVAKARENNTGINPILFRCNMGAGHSGESGRFEAQKLTALKYAFMLDLLGKKT